MCIKKCARVTIRKLTIEDVHKMQEWGKHTDPLYFDYNFPPLNEDEIEEWFKIKTQKKNKKCYSIINEDFNVIGYLTIKGIRRIKKYATLGIVFDPCYVNKGYGTEALEGFLEYYFNEYNMKTLYLDVAKFNLRAIRCYEKCGFIKIKEYKQRIDNEHVRINDDYIQNNLECFDIDNEKNKIYSYIYKMRIEKKK